MKIIFTKWKYSQKESWWKKPHPDRTLGSPTIPPQSFRNVQNKGKKYLYLDWVKWKSPRKICLQMPLYRHEIPKTCWKRGSCLGSAAQKQNLLLLFVVRAKFPINTLLSKSYPKIKSNGWDKREIWTFVLPFCHLLAKLRNDRAHLDAWRIEKLTRMAMPLWRRPATASPPSLLLTWPNGKSTRMHAIIATARFSTAAQLLGFSALVALSSSGGDVWLLEGNVALSIPLFFYALYRCDIFSGVNGSVSAFFGYFARIRPQTAKMNLPFIGR